MTPPSARGKSTHFSVLVHLSRDIVATSKLVAEAVAGVVQEETSNTTESLGGEEFDFCVGLFGVNETGGVDYRRRVDG